jgi:DNA replication protein DnaC
MEISFKENKEAERAINMVKHTNSPLFLTGKAGTGKSTLLRYLISSIEKRYVLLAPTGIAALNIGGQTIHSFFGFGFRPYLPRDRDLPDLSGKIDLIRELDLIIIDEISMVRADIMNAIDLSLKKSGTV